MLVAGIEENLERDLGLMVDNPELMEKLGQSTTEESVRVSYEQSLFCTVLYYHSVNLHFTILYFSGTVRNNSLTTDKFWSIRVFVRLFSKMLGENVP